MDVLRRNNVVVSGARPHTVIFAHGFGCDQNMWRRVAPAFEDEYRVVLFDYVGAGRSDRAAYDPERYGSLGGYARDVLEVCAALDVRGATFVGHSVSGMIGLIAAIAEPERFARLAMVAPSPRYLNDPPDYFGGFERKDIDQLLALMDQNFMGWATMFAQVAARQPELAHELSESFCSTDPRTARAFAHTTFFCDHREDLPRVPVPSLILQCSDDDIVPVVVGQYMHSRMPRSTYRLIEASGHLPHMSHAPETTAILREFIEAPLAARG